MKRYKNLILLLVVFGFIHLLFTGAVVPIFVIFHEHSPI